eukprot:GHRR01031964.1.p3 GENE.GHRR01031964.1~~GHRR01031964.1.p3  ORF type:complete len:117 (+),score=19.74 GHRR01031964.1:64-414(+)
MLVGAQAVAPGDSAANTGCTLCVCDRQCRLTCVAAVEFQPCQLYRFHCRLRCPSGCSSNAEAAALCYQAHLLFCLLVVDAPTHAWSLLLVLRGCPSTCGNLAVIWYCPETALNRAI